MRTLMLGLAVVTVLLVGFKSARAGDDEALRKEALSLNDFMILGDDDLEQKKVVDGKVDELKKDTDHAKKLLAAAATLAADKKPPFTYSAAFLLGTLARELHDAETGQLFFRLCLEKARTIQSARKLANVYLELIALQMENQRYPEAEKTCKEFLQVRGDAEVTAIQLYSLRLLVRIVALQGRMEEAFKLMEPQLKAYGERVDVQRTQAWLLAYDGQYDEAAKIYERILAALKSDKDRTVLHQDLGNLWADAGDADKALPHLQWLLNQQPDEPRYNNALGYLLAGAGRNLDEAEKMLRKAADKEPNQPAYLDSLGWLLYKKKQYAEAKERLQKAIREPEGRHAEIYDHLAETHWALGEKPDAISAWKKALNVIGTSKREQQRKTEIEKKLKEHQE